MLTEQAEFVTLPKVSETNGCKAREFSLDSKLTKEARNQRF